MAGLISFIPENDAAFAAALKLSGELISDLRIPFGLIAADWFVSNQQIFTLKGPGKYPDFVGEQDENGNTAYMRRKINFPNNKSNSPYPLLLGKTGRLAKSLIRKRKGGVNQKPSGDSVLEITKDALVMGTDVDYAKYHQSDEPRKSTLPQRKMVFISGGPKETAKDATSGGRLGRWVNILETHVSSVLEDTGFAP